MPAARTSGRLKEYKKPAGQHPGVASVCGSSVSLRLWRQSAALAGRRGKMPPAARLKLVVTGDDFGYCARRTRGMVECFRAGGLSNVSLLVNGSAAKDAAELAKRRPWPPEDLPRGPRREDDLRRAAHTGTPSDRLAWRPIGMS
ncbi:hypothetical protein CRUP_006916 [Coryphaenoides rupestris]|nr:hypothetical protein CRUP_006916 [Coryphaenoides rupestris]